MPLKQVLMPEYEPPTEDILDALPSDTSELPEMDIDTTYFDEQLTVGMKKFIMPLYPTYAHVRHNNSFGGTQVAWVRRYMTPYIIKRFGALPTRNLTGAIDRYYRNYYNGEQLRRVQNPTKHIPVLPLSEGGPSATTDYSILTPGSRGVGWKKILADSKKEEMEKLKAQERAINPSKNTLQVYYTARNTLEQDTSQEEQELFKAQAKEINTVNRRPPTADDVFSVQHQVTERLTVAIERQLGWKKSGQIGDVLCMLSVAYRLPDNRVKTECALIGSPEVDPHDSRKDVLLNLYKENMWPSFRSFASSFLPENIVEKPLLFPVLDLEEVTTKKLREHFHVYIVNAWEKSSDSRFRARTKENLPWDLLSTVQGQTDLLEKHDGFDIMPSLKPKDMTVKDMHIVAAAIADIPNALVFYKEKGNPIPPLEVGVKLDSGVHIEQQVNEMHVVVDIEMAGPSSSTSTDETPVLVVTATPLPIIPNSNPPDNHQSNHDNIMNSGDTTTSVITFTAMGETNTREEHAVATHTGNTCSATPAIPTINPTIHDPMEKHASTSTTLVATTTAVQVVTAKRKRGRPPMMAKEGSGQPIKRTRQAVTTSPRSLRSGNVSMMAPQGARKARRK